MTVVSAAAARVETVYVLLDPEGKIVGPNAFPTRTAAGSHAMRVHDQYWPQLEARGYRIIPATLQW